MRDPRSHRRYTDLARAYIAANQDRPIRCALCGKPINMQAPRTHSTGPTVEHRLPIRIIMRTATSFAEALNMCCDQTKWAIAHRGCQNRQGGHAANQHAPRVPSRQW